MEQTTTEEAAELGGGSARVWMESDPDGQGGEGVVPRPVEIDSMGLAVSLPSLHPQAGTGGHLDPVKDLWGSEKRKDPLADPQI